MAHFIAAHEAPVTKGDLFEMETKKHLILNDMYRAEWLELFTQDRRPELAGKIKIESQLVHADFSYATTVLDIWSSEWLGTVSYSSIVKVN